MAEKMRSCRACNGNGKHKCPRCDGTGTFMDGSTCYYCKGYRLTKCGACDGTGKIKE